LRARIHIKPGFESLGPLSLVVVPLRQGLPQPLDFLSQAVPIVAELVGQRSRDELLAVNGDETA
jgi:hypothetical protein